MSRVICNFNLLGNSDSVAAVLLSAEGALPMLCGAAGVLSGTLCYACLWNPPNRRDCPQLPLSGPPTDAAWPWHVEPPSLHGFALPHLPGLSQAGSVVQISVPDKRNRGSSSSQ